MVGGGSWHFCLLGGWKRTEWVHEVVEEKKVPRRFCKSDDKLIRAAIKSAVTPDNDCPLEIAGVRIFKRHVSQVR